MASDLEVVTYAYHVTDVLADDNIGLPPDWEYLEKNKAKNEDYDGPLFELGLSGVFLTTTLRDYDLPDRTVYPTDGRRKRWYWRVRVPLTRFNNKRIFKVQEDDDNATNQVLLLLADNKQSGLIDKILKHPDVEEWTEDDYMYNEYLYRDEVTSDWYSNNLNPEDPYWVNIFVPHRVWLGSDCLWDMVQRY